MDQTSSSCPQEKQLLVIDTDAGLDDAQAILMALSAPHVEVIGITTVTGNVSVHQVCKNVLRLLKIANRLDIPVYCGTEKSLTNLNKEDDFAYHGKDGFGDVPDDNPPDLSILQTKHGVQALLDISREYAGKITLVAIGPLTNIALAVRLDPNFGKRLKSCYIMGGNYKGEGNVTPHAEFNFYCDPEAVHIVLSDLGCPITLTCWELCLEYSLSWTEYEEIFSRKTSFTKFINSLEEKTINGFYKENKVLKYQMADQFAIAAAIEPKVILESAKVYCLVETRGQYTTGKLIVDWMNHYKQQSNVTLVRSVNMDIMKKLLVKAFDMK